MNCTDFESVMYYLQVSCEPQFESFVKSPNCGYVNQIRNSNVKFCIRDVKKQPINL